MIRKAKMNEEVFFNKYRGEFRPSIVCCDEKQKIFVNDENLIHNDVGPAYNYDARVGDWFWNGIFIR